eukprot:jgi/Ulvmu1/496/UM001_0504.1
MDDDTAREAKLREFDRYFCATDAVLREDCFAVANAAVNYKGPDGVATFRAKDVIQKLADGYKGYAAIASLVCSWLQKLESQPTTHTSPSEPDEGGHDEFYFLAEFVRQSYSPASFKDVVKHGEAPSWAKDLVSQARGRELVFQLSRSHANCPFIAWAIKATVTAGHAVDVTTPGSCMASYFAVFFKLLTRFGRDLLAKPDAADAMVQDLCAAACHDQHTLALAQAVLTAVCRQRPHSSTPFRYALQEMLRHACSVRGSRAHMMLPLLCSDSAHMRAMHSVAALAAAAHGGELPLAPTQALLSAVESSSRWPADALHYAPLLEALARAACAPRYRCSPELEAAATRLLAIASLTPPSAPSGGAATGTTADISAELDAQEACLRRCAALLRSLFAPRYRPAATFDEVDEVISHRAAASTCVCVTHALLRDAAFFSDAVCLSALPHLLLLLLRVAGAHAALRLRLMRIVADALRAAGSERPEHARGLLHLYLHLLMLGHVEVLEHVRRWAADADVSLVRYFVLQVLARCDGPYSEQFARSMLALMAACSVQRKREVGRLAEARARLLHAFARHVSSMPCVPSMSAGERDLLASLSEAA